MKTHRFLIIFYVLLITTSCNQNSVIPSEDYMVFEDISFVNNFPINVKLMEGEDTGFDIIGLMEFQICDSMLFAGLKGERKGFWQFYSLEDGSYMGKMLDVGQGPNEFSRQIYSPNTFSIYQENEEWYATIYDQPKGLVYKLNISETLKSGMLDMQNILKGIPDMVILVNVLDEDTFFCREVSETMTRQDRYLLTHGKKSVPTTIELLNRAEVGVKNDGYLFNMTSVNFGRHGDYFVEAPIFLNYINLYTLDGRIRKTICTEKRLKSVSSVVEKSDGLRTHTYTALRTFDNFFGVSFLNHTWMEEELGIAKSTQIQLFDWEGTPLAAIDVNRMVSSFDIDFKTGYLYVLSDDVDEFVKYDISDLLKQLNVS